MRIQKLVAAAFLLGGSILLAQPGKRPMTFMDQREMRNATAPVVSPDGKLAVYSISTPDWKADRSQSDLYLVSLAGGLSSTRQLTFTKENERWERGYTSATCPTA
jgi:Tol biopolymer transport system component